MEFHFETRRDILILFCCDPNDINVITYKVIKELCIENKVEFKNQKYFGFITHLKNNSLMSYVDESNLRKNNVLNLINNSSMNVICVYVVLKI